LRVSPDGLLYLSGIKSNATGEFNQPLIVGASEESSNGFHELKQRVPSLR
jgi:hypothetical protein